ncbi:MAG: DUF2029 domain-containing protein [Phenylobacterium sp.]|uniref:glycosyltransferase family 87 protein n=1 Tax=Phenylobacterium sp. TaxID=1871053 RepID=UPI001A5E0F24|nr:glycosyltransferase family 87 protein [Phenylobacterium sp.]MBL8553371.1 DUF2029 domain-containing protein [Phenylobacterium sp.]
MDSPPASPEPHATATRLAAAGKVLALAWIIFLAVGHAAVWRQGADFLNFWSAGRFVLEGRAAEAYDVGRLVAWQQAQGFPRAQPFVSPPPFLILAAPLGLLIYPAALAVWIAAGYAAYALSLRWLPRAVYWPAVAFPGALLAAMAGQSALILTALMCAAVGALPRRPALSGLFVGLMVLKPQLALLTPVAFAAAGAWRAFAVAAATVIGVLGLSVAVLGWEPMAAFLGSADYLNGLFARPELLPKIKSVYATLVLNGASPAAALTGQGVAAAFAAGAVWRVWRATDAPLARGAALAAATPLAPPYLLLYDIVFLALPTVWLLREGLERGFRRGERAALAAVFFLPIATLMAPATWPIVPLWSLGLTLAVLQRLAPPRR